MVGETSAVSGWFFKGAKWGSCGGRSREVVPAPAGFRAKPRGCEGAKEGGGGATRMAFVEEHPAPQRLRGRSHPTGFPTSPNDLPQRRWDAGKPHQAMDPLRPCAPAGNNPPPHRAPPPAGCSRRDAGTQGNPIKPWILCAPAPLREIIPPPHRAPPPAGCSRRDAGTLGNPIKPWILCAPAPLREIIPPPHRVLPPAGCSRRDAGTQGNPSNHGSPASLRPCAPAGKSAASPRATSRGVHPQRRWDAGKPHQTTDPLRPCAPAGKSSASPRGGARLRRAAAREWQVVSTLPSIARSHPARRGSHQAAITSGIRRRRVARGGVIGPNTGSQSWAGRR